MVKQILLFAYFLIALDSYSQYHSQAFYESQRYFKYRETYYKSLKTARKNPDNVEKLDLKIKSPFDFDDFTEFPNLEFVSLEIYCKIDMQTLFTKLSEIDSLIGLSLTGKEIEALPSNIKDLKYLEFLIFFKTSIRELPEELFELKNLEFLHICCNQIQNIPESICKMEKLSDLNLYNNNIKEFPTCFGKLKNLKMLDLRNNEITLIDTALYDLISLKELNLRNNLITEITDDFMKLENIECLIVRGNKIVNIPDNITDLEKLCKINIARKYLGNEDKLQLKELKKRKKETCKSPQFYIN